MKLKELKKIARIAGVLILVTTVFSFFSSYVSSSIVVPEDSTLTANNIRASEGLFRAGMASEAGLVLVEIVLVALFYVLLKPAGRTLALVAAVARLAMTVVQGINLLNHLIPLLLLSGAGYLIAFGPDHLHALVLLFLNAHESVALIWRLFFGFHVLVLAYLVYKSGYIPRLVGVLLLAVSASHLAHSLGNMLLPQYAEIIAWIGYLGIVELVWALWLLIKGVNVEQRDNRAPESA